MNGPTKKLLRHLSDNKWHLEKIKGVGIATVEACIDQGLVVTMRIQRKRKDDLESFRTPIHIAKKGRAALQEISPR